MAGIDAAQSVFVCDTSNQAIRLISSLKAYKHLGEKLGPFIQLFQLEEELSRKERVQSNLEDGLKILKETADLMKDIEGKAYFRTGRRCPQGPDLAFTKPTRDAFKMLHSSFEKTKSFLSENDLHHMCFPSFTTLHVEHFFAGMRTQVVRLQTCLIMPAADQAASLNLYRRCITLPSRCILDHRATTPNAQLTKRSLSGFMTVQISDKKILGEKTVLRKRKLYEKKQEV